LVDESESRSFWPAVIFITLLLVAGISFFVWTKNGLPAGDYYVVQVEGHEKITKNFFAKTESTALFLPAKGQHFVVGNKTSKTTQRLNEQVAGHQEGLPRSVVAWCGDSAMAAYTSSTAPGKKTKGTLFVGPKGSEEYEILEFTSRDNVALIAKSLLGRPLIVNNGFSNVPHTLMNGQQANDPEVVEFLAEISDKEASLWCLTSSKDSSGNTVLQTVSADPKETFALRCSCALGAWILSDGKSGDPLAKLMLEFENRDAISGKGPWDLFELHETIRQPPEGKIKEYISFIGAATDQQVETEAQAIENIFRSWPKDGSLPFKFPRLARYDLWAHVGMPMQLCFNRMTPVGERTDPKSHPLFKRLLKSEVKSLAVLMEKISQHQP